LGGGAFLDETNLESDEDSKREIEEYVSALFVIDGKKVAT
jgi:hypothetical protein